MSRNVLVITVDGNKYKVEKNGISDFALIGVLECILSDLKSAKRWDEGSATSNQSTEVIKSNIVESAEDTSEDTSNQDIPKPENTGIVEAVELGKTEEPAAVTPDLRSRIIKARQAIRGLNGEVDDTDLTGMSEAELEEEFEALTAQYKRLKNTQSSTKDRKLRT